VALATELGGRAVPFDDWAAEFEKIDIVISSTSAPHHILDRAKLGPLMKTRKQRPLLLIDIAVPRDIDPAVQHLENVFLYNIDHLEELMQANVRLREREVAVCRKIIEEHTAEFMAKINPASRPPHTLQLQPQVGWTFSGGARPAFEHEQNLAVSPEATSRSGMAARSATP